MRSEREIRAHLENVKLLLTTPCQCMVEGTAHAMQCRIGGALMRAEIAALKFALGECENDHFVESVAKRAAVIREEREKRKK